MGGNGRRPIVAGNWKMNKTVGEALGLVRDLRGMVSILRDKVEIVVAPPFTAIHPVAKALEGSNIAVAGQDCHWESSGAFTGEVSATMLKEAGCRYAIVGHSERRASFGDTDEIVNRKARAVLAAGLFPIVCVGETLAEREAGRTLEVIDRQVKAALHQIDPERVGSIVVAYEPVWAIGTGKNATSAQAQEVHATIREGITRQCGRDISGQVRIQYGGSVKPENAAELIGQPDVDGALVGGASLKAADFAAIVKGAAKPKD